MPDAPAPGPHRAGLVSLIGRPNAGKSTLLNRFVGQKVAIVSDKPQTTRHRVRGVKTVAGRGQIVFIDTPGIHKPIHRMNQRMVDAAIDTLREVEVIVVVVDATELPGTGDRFVMDRVRAITAPAILALNKIDRVSKPDLLPLIAGYARDLAWRAIVPISAFTGEGVPALEDEILAALPEGPALYPEDDFTDQTERTLASELVREKVLQLTRDELPYATAVIIEKYEEPQREGGITRIYASILVDTDSQKPIVVGKGGAMIKQIGTAARQDLEVMLGGKVYLELHVKVRESWRDDERLLNELGVGRHPPRR